MLNGKLNAVISLFALVSLPGYAEMQCAVTFGSEPVVTAKESVGKLVAESSEWAKGQSGAKAVIYHHVTQSEKVLADFYMRGVVLTRYVGGGNDVEMPKVVELHQQRLFVPGDVVEVPDPQGHKYITMTCSI